MERLLSIVIRFFQFWFESCERSGCSENVRLALVWLGLITESVRVN